MCLFEMSMPPTLIVTCKVHKKPRNFVQQKAYHEGSIGEDYLAKEALFFLWGVVIMGDSRGKKKMK